jgi:phosphoglucan,water dikinase
MKAKHPDSSIQDDPFFRELIEAARTFRSWRQRLQWLRDRLADSAFSLTPSRLALLAVYLRLLATGELPCQEDGGHYRPNHHAEAALRIESALERIDDRDSAWIARRLYPYLPSWGDSFRRGEPLTRIRDIAHRNDIPPDLKREIKTRLQNKLHRCAGPEDLRTADELLARITASGTSYSPTFVAEFRLFHQELQEFFNAQALQQRLADLARDVPALADRVAAIRPASGPMPSLEEVFVRLQRVTALRQCCLHEIAGKSAELRSRLRLADLGLEDLAFALLVAGVTRLETDPRPNLWSLLLHALDQTLVQLQLSLIDPLECQALHHELQVWSQGFDPQQRLHLLRVRASLQRIGRLAENWSDRIEELFGPAVTQLGAALGVAEPAIRVFVEGFVRGHLLFPLSRLADLGLRWSLRALQLPALEPVVPGQTIGVLLTADHLGSLTEPGDPAIALIRHAEGDEEIPSRVRGILLAHPIPHLSHLGVRARQARVPFVCCTDLSAWNSLHALVGQRVHLRVQADRVELQPTTAVEPPSLIPTAATRIIAAEQEVGPVVVSLNAATADLCGAKAASCGTLRRLADRSSGRFQVPRGLALPFGVLHQALSAAGRLAEYQQASERLPRLSLQEQQRERRHLYEMLNGLPVPEEVITTIRDTFGPECRLAVRSSSNSEDLPGLAGAGLYDSVVGVTVAEVNKAVARVWTSLWTSRAFQSRSQAGIAHDQARMGVLIQELIEPDLSFILHTTDPLSGRQESALVELAVGLGEVLASASVPGTPYRLQCPRRGGDPVLLACANFSVALRPGIGGQPIPEILDYSRVPLSAEPTAAVRLANRLGQLAEWLETELGAPQDVEGVIVGETVYVVQSRPQQGLQG